ncbi:ATP-binding protein [Streptomyces bottropensis]|uniref:ATP-binding protein n=1 Tax=Streptomyces bottropensis TaxID=42235 RepID=UPI0036AE3B22
MLSRFEESPYAFTVPPQLNAVSVARDRVGRRAHQLGLALGDGLTQDLKLLTGELVANAVTYTQAACVVSVRWIGDRLRVEVTDVDPTPVRASEADAMEESGRGLFLVDVLATAWGSEPCEAGKKTWFELVVPVSVEATAAMPSSHVNAIEEASTPTASAQERIEHQAA